DFLVDLAISRIGASPYATADAPFDALSRLLKDNWFNSSTTQTREITMLQKLIKLYRAYMMTGVTSPLPHLAGPPGVGKSSVVKELANLLGVQLHTINVSRLSPLEIEGIQ